MKSKLLLIALLLISTIAIAQTKNNISVFWAPNNGNMFTYNAIGDFGYYPTGNSTEFGINYEHQLNNKWSLETGFQFTDVPLLRKSSIPPVFSQTAEDRKLITVPILAKVTFWDLLSLDGGVLASIETDTPPNDQNTKQAGLGLELGAGLQHNFGQFRVFVNPYMQMITIIPLTSAQSHFSIINTGWKFGMGYNF